jgi:hypothetical protein
LVTSVLTPCDPSVHAAALYENTSCAASLVLAGSLSADRTELAALFTYWNKREREKDNCVCEQTARSRSALPFPNTKSPWSTKSSKRSSDQRSRLSRNRRTTNGEASTMAVDCVVTAISFDDSFNSLLSYEQYPHLVISHAGNTPKGGSWCSAHGAVVWSVLLLLLLLSLRLTIGGLRIFAAGWLFVGFHRKYTSLRAPLYRHM